MNQSRISMITAKIINNLYNNGNLNTGVLANLRDAQSVLDHHATAVWPLMLQYLDKPKLSTTGKPTYEENAVFLALKCYAIYQQGQVGQCVYASLKDNGISLFTALNDFRSSQSPESRSALDKRVNVVLASMTATSIFNNIVRLEQILKSQANKRYRLDFGQLAQDFYRLQFNYEEERQVCLSWGRDYFYAVNELDN